MAFYKKIWIAIPLITFSIIPEDIVFAQNKITDAPEILGKAHKQTGLPTTDLPSFIGSAIQISLQLVSVIFLALMVYGGFLWMTARGSEDQVAKARSTIISSIIGLVIVVAAYAITSLVTGSFTP